jgi:fructose-bisphosphate aldolase class I
MAMLTAKLSCSPAATTRLGRRSAPTRRASVVRASAGSYADELVSTAVSARIRTLLPVLC